MNRVLFVDDEALILNSLKRGLKDEAYVKFFATSGEQALSILAEEEISVLVTDMKMPGMTGLELLKEVKVKYPDIVKIVLSGYTHLPQVLVTVNQGDIFKFITKPWDLENEFKYIIREAVDYYNYKLEIKRAQSTLEKKNVTFQNILKSYDEKLAVFKDEIQLMKELNVLVFREQAKLIKFWDPNKENRSMMIERAAALNVTLQEIFALLPLIQKKIVINTFVEEFKKSFLDARSLNRFDVGVDEKVPLQLKGYSDLLMLLLKKVVKIFIVESSDTTIHMVFSGEERSEDMFLLKAVLQVETSKCVSGDLKDSVTLLFQAMLVQLGGEFAVREHTHNRLFFLTMPFKL